MNIPVDRLETGFPVRALYPESVRPRFARSNIACRSKKHLRALDMDVGARAQSRITFYARL